MMCTSSCGRSSESVDRSSSKSPPSSPKSDGSAGASKNPLRARERERNHASPSSVTRSIASSTRASSTDRIQNENQNELGRDPRHPSYTFPSVQSIDRSVQRASTPIESRNVCARVRRRRRLNVPHRISTPVSFARNVVTRFVRRDPRFARFRLYSSIVYFLRVSNDS